MPESPPQNALDAIARIKGFKAWEPVEMYRAIREALQEPSGPVEPVAMPGDGAHANQGDR